MGVNRREPVLAWLLRGQLWLTRGSAARVGRLSFILALLLGALAGAVALRVQVEGALILLVLGSRIVLDGLAMARSWGRIGLEYQTGRWDVLRLTSQSEGAILRAHYAAAYAGVWRPLLIVLGIQSGVLLTMSAVAVARIALHPAALISMALVSLAFIAILNLDLLWRPRALTALGLALSASVPRAGMAVVAGGIALIGYWFAQLAALGTGSVLTSFLAIFSMDEASAVTMSLLMGSFAFVLPLLVTVFVQRAALFRLAAAVAARDDAN